MSSFNDYATTADYLRTAAFVEFGKLQEEGVSTQADECFHVISTDRDQVSLPWAMSLATAEEWNGTKGFNGQRSYTHDIELVRYHLSEYYKRKNVMATPELVAQSQKGFIANAPYKMYDVAGFTYLLTNPTSYDGAALLSASHRDSHDNLLSSAVGAVKRTIVEEALDQQQAVTLANGVRVDVKWNELWCSSATYFEWIEELGPERRTNVNSSGAYDQTTGVVGMGSITNTAAGIRVRQIEQFSGEQYLFVDTSASWKRPVICAKNGGLDLQIMDGESDSLPFLEDKIAMSFHSLHGYGPGLWEFCAGNFTAS